ncbi:MAG: hypothetical protein M0C28_21905 [Candidatus Moduliflexus flocculans]|nr:hypothetical protein [Candidatus Moduliflexus flocculans]
MGDYYVRFNDLKKEDPTAEEKAQDLLVKWEAGDPETLALWKTMNEWAVGGIKQTYERTGHLLRQVLPREPDLRDRQGGGPAGPGEPASSSRPRTAPCGSTFRDIGLDDEGPAPQGRHLHLHDPGHRHWPSTGTRTGPSTGWSTWWPTSSSTTSRSSSTSWRASATTWAGNLYHLSYGLVNLPEGRMKTREGTVVDADTLLDSLRELRRRGDRGQGPRGRGRRHRRRPPRRSPSGPSTSTSSRRRPSKDMIFNPKESLVLQRRHRPLHPVHGRADLLHAPQARGGEGNARGRTVRPELLVGDAEWALVRRIAGIPEAVDAGRAVTSTRRSWPTCLYDLAAAFSRVLPRQSRPRPPRTRTLAATRLGPGRGGPDRAAGTGLDLVCIPFLETM